MITTSDCRLHHQSLPIMFDLQLTSCSRFRLKCISHRSSSKLFYFSTSDHLLHRSISDRRRRRLQSSSSYHPIFELNFTNALSFQRKGSAVGWGRLDDAGVVKVCETLTAVRVEGKLHVLSKESILKSLPSEWRGDLSDDIHSLYQQNVKTLVILDDDPTGTQTVPGIDVFAEWSVDSLIEQFRKGDKCLFILTNSRTLSYEKASALISNICKNLAEASKLVNNVDFTVVLRGDSTLRGHFP